MTFTSHVTVKNFIRRLHAFTTFGVVSMAACFFLAPQAAKAERVLIFGVVPQQSATRLAQVWVPFLEAFEARTGLTFKFTTAKDIPTFEACLAKRAYDVAYMNPYHYAVVHETAGYEAFAHQSDKKLKGVLVTRVDSDIEGLDDLQDQAIAFPSPAAFGASVLPRAELALQDIRIEPSYVKSHDSVYRGVALGLFPAGGGVVRTFGNIPDDLKAQLRIFHRTDAYTPHAFATAAELDPEIRAALVSAIADIHEPDVLGPLGMAGFQIADDRAWDDVRALQLTSTQTGMESGESASCHSD